MQSTQFNLEDHFVESRKIHRRRKNIINHVGSVLTRDIKSEVRNKVIDVAENYVETNNLVSDHNRRHGEMVAGALYVPSIKGFGFFFKEESNFILSASCVYISRFSWDRSLRESGYLHEKS